MYIILFFAVFVQEITSYFCLSDEIVNKVLCPGLVLGTPIALIF